MSGRPTCQLACLQLYSTIPYVPVAQESVDSGSLSCAYRKFSHARLKKFSTLIGGGARVGEKPTVLLIFARTCTVWHYSRLYRKWIFYFFFTNPCCWSHFLGAMDWLLLLYSHCRRPPSRRDQLKELFSKSSYFHR